MHYQDAPMHDIDFEDHVDPEKLSKKGKENDRSDNIFWKSTIVNFQEQNMYKDRQIDR